MSQTQGFFEVFASWLLALPQLSFLSTPLKEPVCCQHEKHMAEPGGAQCSLTLPGSALSTLASCCFALQPPRQALAEGLGCCEECGLSSPSIPGEMLFQLAQ